MNFATIHETQRYVNSPCRIIPFVSYKILQAATDAPILLSLLPVRHLFAHSHIAVTVLLLLQQCMGTKAIGAGPKFIPMHLLQEQRIATSGDLF